MGTISFARWQRDDASVCKTDPRRFDSGPRVQKNNRGLAQLVEQWILIPLVAGSSPAPPAINNKRRSHAQNSDRELSRNFTSALIAAAVTMAFVAEWLRQRIVIPSTQVRFLSIAPPICPWRSPEAQRFPKPEVAGSNPAGRANQAKPHSRFSTTPDPGGGS